MYKSYQMFIIGNSKNHKTDNLLWCRTIVEKLKEYSDNKISFTYAPNYFNEPYTEEDRILELNQIQDSDLVIVDLCEMKDNISAHCILSSIQMMNKVRTKHTFVIGIGKLDTDNVWLTSCIFKQFPTIDDAVDYITDKIII